VIDGLEQECPNLFQRWSNFTVWRFPRASACSRQVLLLQNAG